MLCLVDEYDRQVGFVDRGGEALEVVECQVGIGSRQRMPGKVDGQPRLSEGFIEQTEVRRGSSRLAKTGVGGGGGKVFFIAGRKQVNPGLVLGKRHRCSYLFFATSIASRSV